MIETTKIVLDLAVIFLIVFGLFRGIRKGFVQTLYQALRWILCLILAQILYPYVADFLRQIGLLEMIQGGLEESLSEMMSGSGNTSMIQSLPLPEFLKDVLVQNDNSVVYEMLNVTTLTGYVAAYLATMAINILSVVVLLVVLLLLSHLIGAALNILTKLPVIHSLNALLGGAAGAFQYWRGTEGLSGSLDDSGTHRFYLAERPVCAQPGSRQSTGSLCGSAASHGNRLYRSGYDSFCR